MIVTAVVVVASFASAVTFQLDLTVHLSLGLQFWHGYLA